MGFHDLKEDKTMTVDKNMTLGDIFFYNQNAKKTLIDMGMGFASFPPAERETLEDACAFYGLETDEVVQKLNELEKPA